MELNSRILSRGKTTTLAIVILASILIYSDLSFADTKQDKDRELIESLSKFDQCVIQATYSFIYASSYPAETIDELKRQCQLQSEAFKCVKEKTKGSLPLVRRGMLSFVQNRQRHHKKLCTNLQSEVSKDFVEAMKCIREKKFSNFHAADREVVKNLETILRKNYNDSAPELKQLCCAFHNFTRKAIENVGRECEKYAETVKVMVENQGPGENMHLICEDEEKLTKICPKLEPIQLDSSQQSTYPLAANTSAASLGLYLVATLGEAY